jgi:hypothetical protein
LDTFILARLGGAELAALVAGAVFVLIMGYLLFGGGSNEPDPKPPVPGKSGSRQPKTRR